MSQNTSCIFYLPPWTYKTSSKYVIDGNFPLHVLINTYTIISRWIRTTCHCKHKNKEQIVKVIPNNPTTQVDWCCLSRSQQKETPYQALTRFLPTQSSGPYNRWLVCDTCEGVTPRLQGSFSVPIWSICGAWEARKRTNMYMWHTSQWQTAILNKCPEHLS